MATYQGANLILRMKYDDMQYMGGGPLGKNRVIGHGCFAQYDTTDPTSFTVDLWRNM